MGFRPQTLDIAWSGLYVPWALLIFPDNTKDLMRFAAGDAQTSLLEHNLSCFFDHPV